MKACITAVLVVYFALTFSPAGGQTSRKRTIETSETEWRELAPIDVKDVRITGRFGHLIFRVNEVEYLYMPVVEGSNHAPAVSASIALLGELRRCEKFRVKFEVDSSKPADRKSIVVEDIVVSLGNLK